MGKIRNIKTPDNEIYDIYGKNVENIDWSDYKALPASKTSDDVAYFIDNIPAEEMADENIGTFSGALATFDNAMAMPMPSLKASIKAKQDLHGYDKPWVGGAGKNKLPMTVDGIKSANTSGTWSGNSYAINGVTFSILIDSDGNVVGIATSGTSSNYIYFTLAYVDAEIGMIINGAPTGGDRYKWFQAVDTTSDFDYGNGATISISVTNKKFMIVVANGIDMSNKTFYPMIRLATESDPTFAPYSNICPISGWDAANVSDVGKNLFDKTSQGIVGYALDPNNGSTYVSSSGKWDVTGFIEIEGGSNYTLSGSNSDVAFFDENKTYINGWSSFGTKTAPQNAKYIKFDFLHANVDSVQLELGSTATSYEPYINQTTTISLGQTVYGGELDVVNGASGNKITYGYVDLGNVTYTKAEVGSYVIFYSAIGNKALNYNYICSHYRTVEKGREELEDGDIGTYNTGNARNYICIRDDSKSSMTAEEFKAAMSGAQLVYELATPTTFATQPTPIKSLEGTNNLSVDCGEVIEGEYFKQLDKQIRLNDSVYGRSPEAIHAIYADIAEKATQDESGNNIKASYANAISISDHTITLKNKNGTSLGTVTIPDNNTTYTLSANTTNNKITLTPNSGTAQSITVPYATKATQDESGNNIKANYASSISISDHTITLKNKNNISLGTVTVPNDFVTPVEKVTTPTPLATFEASEMPMPTLKASIKAKQDLHGYDKPWVGGAGKNKLNISVENAQVRSTDGTWSGDIYTYRGVTFTFAKDSGGNVIGITANGTATGGNAILKIDVSLDSVNYIINGCSGGSVSTYQTQVCKDNGNAILNNFNGEQNITPENATNTKQIQIIIRQGYTASNLTFHPMIRLSTVADSTFAPYTNICPISGWDAANVSDAGKNLFDASLMTSPIHMAKWVQIQLKANTTYTVSSSIPYSSTSAYIFAVQGTDTSGATSGTNGVGSGHNQTITTGDDGVISIGYRSNGASGVLNLDDYTYQIEVGTSASEYVPYIEPNLYTITLGQTVYGGEVDVVNGGGKSKFGLVELSTLPWVYSAEWNRFQTPFSGYKRPASNNEPVNAICSCFSVIGSNGTASHSGNYCIGANAGSDILSARNENYTSAADFIASLTGQTLCYELATPTTFTTQPTPIKSLEGTNNLSVDCGEVMECEYMRPEYNKITAKIAENADKLNGYSSSTEVVGNSIVRRLSNGDIRGRSYNLGMPSADPNGNTYPGQFIPYVDKDYWIRPASPANVKRYMGMENVENKSSATIRSELTKANVTTALGYTPIKGNSEEDWFEDYVQPDTNIEWVDHPTYYINDSGLCQLSFSVKSTTDRTSYGNYPFGLVTSDDDFSNMMIDSNALITIKVNRASDPTQWVVCAGLTELSTVGNKLEIICCNPVYANDKIFVNVIWLK